MGYKENVMNGFDIYKDEVFHHITFYDKTDEYLAKETLENKLILDKIPEFKERASRVITLDKKDSFNKLVDLYFDNKNFIWYYGMIFEATLECMELLSGNATLSQTYSLINPSNKNMFFDSCLNERQIEDIIKLIAWYHPYGNKFYQYAENRKAKIKKKVIN